MKLAAKKLTENHRQLVIDLDSVRSHQELIRHPQYLAHKDSLEEFLGRTSLYSPSPLPKEIPRDFLRVTAWNVERGSKFDQIQETLARHPALANSDIILVTETDYGMARSGNRHVAHELGKSLGLYSLFGPCFLNLVKGNGQELHVQGENTVALQGNAILSRYPFENVELIPLPSTKDHMAGKERQIGREQAILATIKTPFGLIHFVCVHLAAHSAVRHRRHQMHQVLKALNKRPGPALIGGDWNTTTYNANRAVWAILGFWRRVAMGVRYVMRTHYPYPERYFEKRLFQNLKKERFEIDGFNVPGKCTVHYDFNEADPNLNLADWVPNWCFKFIHWALEPFEGRCSFKIDWFAGRDLIPQNPVVVSNLPRASQRLSDHDPIVIDIRLRE